MPPFHVAGSSVHAGMVCQYCALYLICRRMAAATKFYPSSHLRLSHRMQRIGAGFLYSKGSVNGATARPKMTLTGMGQQCAIGHFTQFTFFFFFSQLRILSHWVPDLNIFRAHASQSEWEIIVKQSIQSTLHINLFFLLLLPSHPIE